ncbi:MAG: hypothetical protein IKK03_16380 [Lachnospiraceae bacterium]|nr:hypothetical protein [Lachnospiraceae bacterium]
MPKFRYPGVYIDNKSNKDSVHNNIKGVFTQFYNTIMNMDYPLANKLLYWLNDWSGYILPNEKNFKYNDLIKYEQYSIFEANFGFNVGSEAGGLHYGVIVDKDNSKSSKILMVIPFKSLDEGETEEDIDSKTEVYLGDKVFEVEVNRQKDKLRRVNLKLQKYEEKNDAGSFVISKDENYKQLLKKKSYYETEIAKMSRGTIAQVGQMCLMSKMRIYYPTTTSEKLYGIKLSPENVEKIKEKFNELYF